MNTAGKSISMKIGNSKAASICKHCGGKMRFYMGEFSCLMCGREIGHVCKGCPSKK